MSAASAVTEYFPFANPIMINQMGFIILGESLKAEEEGSSYLVVSTNQTFYETEDAAWIGAMERLNYKNPSWHIDLSKYGVHSRK